MTPFKGLISILFSWNLVFYSFGAAKGMARPVHLVPISPKVAEVMIRCHPLAAAPAAPATAPAQNVSAQRQRRVPQLHVTSPPTANASKAKRLPSHSHPGPSRNTESWAEILSRRLWSHLRDLVAMAIPFIGRLRP